MRGLRAKISDGKVTQTVVVDTDNIPDHMADWPDGEGLEVGMSDDGQGGYAFIAKTSEEVEAEIDKETDAEKSKGQRADRLMLFRVLKAADPSYTKAQFRSDRRELIAAMS